MIKASISLMAVVLFFCTAGAALAMNVPVDNSGSTFRKTGWTMWHRSNLPGASSSCTRNYYKKGVYQSQQNKFVYDWQKCGSDKNAISARLWPS
ncbi:hypothetical protein RHD99_09105 [Buttiauxella selenatireducens]|uniref:Lactococcin 972 family bacteriocin n=1 Tax=Buttiauxella selenatireducens TaxID=3073902 RepID=A0ABY9SI22_9ENTR|nr:hypothetical protein [Buttiauxella sp. R73]WMY76071.1 hypothetical protein RHD99_09105 [Buttiauxella sp. R73]